MSGRAPSSPEDAFISLGSNIEPERHLPLAVERLKELGRVAAHSAVFQSAAVGAEGTPDFLNAAVLLRTSLDARAIRDRLRAAEAALGRVRGPDKYAPRTLDLDLCLLGDAIMDDGVLVLPDPDILTRPYLAVTLAEIDPGRRYPGRDETLAEIAGRLRRGADLARRDDVTGLLARALGWR